MRRSPNCFDHQASKFFSFVPSTLPAIVPIAFDRFGQRVASSLDNFALLDARLDAARPLLGVAPR